MGDAIYSGFDREKTRDWSGLLVGWMRGVLPTPEISPTCVKQGHRWSEPLLLEWRPTPVRVYGCVRCAKRGLLVLKDDQ